MALDPRQYGSIFGKTWLDRQSQPVLQIGKKRWTRYELISKVGVGNMGAVAILRQVLELLEVRGIRDLKDISPRDLAAIKGVGATTLFVLMSLLADLGGEGFDVEEWYGSQRTFQTLKDQERKQGEQGESKISGLPGRSGVSGRE